MQARVNHGRWIVDCLHCSNAELAPPGVGLVQCSLCGQYSEVEHPDQWEEIDRVLHCRPMDKRNWYPGETIERLLAENLEHGTRIV